MRLSAVILIISLICLPAWADIRDIPAPVLLNRNIRIVLSQQQRELYPYTPTWALIPDFYSHAYDNSAASKYIFPDGTGTAIYTVSLDGANDNILSVLMELASPLSDKYMKDDDDEERKLFSPYLYADVSAVILSYVVRQISNNKFDLLLLTPDLDADDDDLLKGVEIGVRLNPTYGLRLRLKDTDNDTTGYGMEFQMYPSDNTTIKFIHEDNDSDKSTGVEFKVDF